MSPSSYARVKLARAEDWDDWINQSQRYLTDLNLWTYANPSIDEPEPEPQAVDYKPAAQLMEMAGSTSLGYEPLIYEQRQFERRYARFTDLKRKAAAYIELSVGPRGVEALQTLYVSSEAPTLYSRLRCLKKEFEPSIDEQVLFLEQRLQRLEETSNVQSFDDWSLEWRSLKLKFERYDFFSPFSVAIRYSRAVAEFNDLCSHILYTGLVGGDSPDDVFDNAIRMMRMISPHRATTQTLQVHPTSQDEGSEAATAGDRSKPAQLPSTQAKQKPQGKQKTQRKQKPQKKQKPQGCSSITGKTPGCRYLGDCDVINPEKRPQPANRSDEWKEHFQSFIDYCENNRQFAEYLYKRFNDPEVAELLNKGPSASTDLEDTVCLAPLATTGGRARTYDRWVLGETDMHIVNNATRAEFEVQEVPQDYYVESGAQRFKVAAVGTCTLRIRTLNGKVLPLILQNVACIPGFYVNITSLGLLRKAGLFLNGGANQMIRVVNGEDVPLLQVVRPEGIIPYLDVTSPATKEDPITEWPVQDDGRVYGQISVTTFAAGEPYVMASDA